MDRFLTSTSSRTFNNMFCCLSVSAKWRSNKTVLFRFCRKMYLLLSQYHPLDVFKLFLQPADLFTVQSHIQTARTVRGGAQPPIPGLRGLVQPYTCLLTSPLLHCLPLLRAPSSSSSSSSTSSSSPAALWHHPSPIQSLRKLNLLRQKPCASLEKEGGIEEEEEEEERRKRGKKERAKQMNHVICTVPVIHGYKKAQQRDGGSFRQSGVSGNKLRKI
ncbi:hypothetical protein INR49_026300 [Caranx melampygus]|nr:hypothetical protein INR49_026300 [Caranx melampygus]